MTTCILSSQCSIFEQTRPYYQLEPAIHRQWIGYDRHTNYSSAIDMDKTSLLSGYVSRTNLFFEPWRQLMPMPIVCWICVTKRVLRDEEVTGELRGSSTKSLTRSASAGGDHRRTTLCTKPDNCRWILVCGTRISVHSIRAFTLTLRAY